MKTRTERHVTLAPPVATPVQPLTFEEKKARLENISAEWRSWIHHIVFWNAGAGVTGGTVAGLAGGLLETSNHGSNTNLHNVGMNAAQLPLGVLELTTEVGFVLEVSGLTAGGTCACHRTRNTRRAGKRAVSGPAGRVSGKDTLIPSPLDNSYCCMIVYSNDSGRSKTCGSPLYLRVLGRRAAYRIAGGNRQTSCRRTWPVR